MQQVFLVFILSIVAATSFAAEHTVHLVTESSKGERMAMEPGYIKIDKGDTINFIPSDATHNAESFYIPAGAKAFNTPLNGQPTKVTFEVEGIYLYQCMPHAPFGMLGVVQVGNPHNLDRAKKEWENFKTTVAIGKERMDRYMDQIK